MELPLEKQSDLPLVLDTEGNILIAASHLPDYQEEVKLVSSRGKKPSAGGKKLLSKSTASAKTSAAAAAPPAPAPPLPATATPSSTVAHVQSSSAAAAPQKGSSLHPPSTLSHSVVPAQSTVIIVLLTAHLYKKCGYSQLRFYP